MYDVNTILHPLGYTYITDSYNEDIKRIQEFNVLNLMRKNIKTPTFVKK